MNINQWNIHRKELEVEREAANLPVMLKEQKNKINKLHERLEVDLSLAEPTGIQTTKNKVM